MCCIVTFPMLGISGKDGSDIWLGMAFVICMGVCIGPGDAYDRDMFEVE